MLRVLITLGATREYIDPVRFISNPSTGRMGAAFIPLLLQDSNIELTVIQAHTEIDMPLGNYHIIQAETIHQMETALQQVGNQQDIIIMSAAVGDYQVKQYQDQKIKRGLNPNITLELTMAPDLIHGIAKKNPQIYCVAFAAETESSDELHQKKLSEKKVQALFMNQVNATNTGFQSQTNAGVLYFKSGRKHSIDIMSKSQVAECIWQEIMKDRSQKET